MSLIFIFVFRWTMNDDNSTRDMTQWMIFESSLICEKFNLCSLFHVCALWIFFLYVRFVYILSSAFRFLHKYRYLLACNRCNQIKPNELNATQLLRSFFSIPAFTLNEMFDDREKKREEKRRGEKPRDFSFHYFISFY